MERTEHSMGNKNLNHVAAIEKAIAEKYGKEAIQNPKKDWDEEKEKEYMRQRNEMYDKMREKEDSIAKINLNGFIISTKLFNRESLSQCPVCGNMPKKTLDDVCMLKFDCCGECYIKYVEGREERWLTGWRPEINKE